MNLSELPLENYVQRLDRCQAYRYRHADQTTELARLLRARSYNFSRDDSGGWTLVVQGKLDGCAAEFSEIVVNRGDFIMLKNWERLEYEIMPASIFRSSFEQEAS